MSWSWRIGRLLGVDIYIHVSFLLIVALFVVGHYLPNHSVNEALFGLVMVLSLFGIVVLHELGHATAASWYGIKTRDITLYPIGGVARLERIPEKPIQELVVALAGPAVNVVLAGILFLVLSKMPDLSKLGSLEKYGEEFLEKMYTVNVGLVVFNMIPAFPMDGGRVLRAFLAFFLEYTVATRIAALLGQIAAGFFGIAGLTMGNPILAIVGFFVWMAASQESQMVALRASLAGVPVGRAMIRDFRSVAPEQDIAHAADLLLAGFQQDFPVVENGRVVGMLLRHDIVEHLRGGSASALIRDVMRPEVHEADPREMLDSAFGRLQESESRSLVVVRDGQLMGLLTPDNIGEFLMVRKAIRGS